jgi:hypothetical protein
MSAKKRIEELERRVRELEARPYWPPTIILQPFQPQPPTPTWPMHPWSPLLPSPLPYMEPVWVVQQDALPFYGMTTQVTS